MRQSYSFILRMVFFCATLAGVFVLPWAVVAAVIVYATYRMQYEMLIPALLLDGLYSPLLPLWGVVGMPHVCAVLLLLIGFRMLRSQMLSA